jgi:hypothetical protein
MKDHVESKLEWLPVFVRETTQGHSVKVMINIGTCSLHEHKYTSKLDTLDFV